MSNDVRRIFTYFPGEKPELLFVSGADTNDEYVKQMVKNLCEDRAKVLATKGGFFIFTRTIPNEGLFRAIISAPDGTKVATLQNVLGTNELTIKVDPLTVLAVTVLYNLSFTLAELIEFFTQALMQVVVDYVPESAKAAREEGAKPEVEPEPEPEKCQNCDPDIKALCKQVRGETIN